VVLAGSWGRSPSRRRRENRSWTIFANFQ